MREALRTLMFASHKFLDAGYIRQWRGIPSILHGTSVV
jgi:hypothetical protein